MTGEIPSRSTTMTLKNLLKKRSKAREHEGPDEKPMPVPTTAHEFTFMRSDTNTQEVLSLPPSPDELSANASSTLALGKDKSSSSRRHSRFRSSSNVSTTSRDSKTEKRLSSLLSLRSHSHESRKSSANVPTDLPNIDDSHEGNEKEAKWEERATILAQGNPNLKHGTAMNEPQFTSSLPVLGVPTARQAGERPAMKRQISDAAGDVGARRPRMEILWN